jgi:(1->4)-alpha-D-glucan 1-alpha-D-glucosylmutase
VLSELPQDWAAAVAGWQAAPGLAGLSGENDWNDPARQLGRPDPAIEYLAWHTAVGCWPINADRLTEYLTKAAREAKLNTSWTSPDEEYETAVRRFAEAVVTDPDLRTGIEAFAERIAPYAEVNMLAQKLIQLTMTGVPDIYQGAETRFLALVDPDNRRPVDFGALAALLDQADAQTGAQADLPGLPDPSSLPDIAVAKMLLVSRTLRLRREHPDWFGPAATQSPLLATGPAAEHAVAFLRGEHVAVVATRLPVGLVHSGGWRDTALSLPDGSWRCRLTGLSHHTKDHGGSVPMAELLRHSPVALLVQEGSQ